MRFQASLPVASPIPTETGAMELVGEARMQALFWKVYDARLYAPNGRWNADDRFALSLTYLRTLSGAKIAERSIQEIRQQGLSDERTLARWYESLAALIPDVQDQDEIIGFVDENAHTSFYLGDELLGTIPEPEFTRAFFAIWLSDETSEPNLRKQLLGDQS